MKSAGRVLSLLLLIVLILGGCGGNRKAMGDDDLLRIGDEVFTKQEAMVFLLSQHTIYAGEYGEEIWNVQLSEGSFETYVKKAMLDYLERLFLTDCAARADGIALSITESSAAEKAADGFWQGLSEETKEKTGLTRELCLQACVRYARAQIFFRKVLGRTPGEISEDEARATVLQIVAVEKSRGITAARELLDRITADKKKTAAEAAAGAEGVSIRRETVIRGTYGGNFDTIVFALKKDQWSPVITMPEEYLLVQCLEVSNPAATAVNKAAMEKANRERDLQEAVASYAKDITMIFNSAAWEDVSLSAFAGLSQVNIYDHTDSLRADY